MKKELKELVLAEAIELKKYITKEEKDRLNFESLDGQNPIHCIYAQLFGWAFSLKSNDLKNLCAKPYSSNLDYYRFPVLLNTRLNFTPIEFYICQEGAQNENLINFLKDKDDLTIDDL